MPGSSSKTLSQEFCRFAELSLPYVLVWSLRGSGWELEKLFPVLFFLAVNYSMRIPYQEPHLQNTVLSPEPLLQLL